MNFSSCLRTGSLSAFAFLLLTGCPGVIELKSKTAIKGGAAKSTVAPIVYDDFEKSLGGAWTYGNTEGGGACAAAEESTVFHAGGKALRVDYKSGSGSWGCGTGWTTAYMPTAGFFNATGTIGVEFWAKAPRGVTFQFSLKEAKANGGDDEVYLAPAVTGTGSWKKYFLPYDTYTRGIYSGNQGGDDTLTKAGLGSMDIQFDAKQGDGALYVDDIYFK